MNSLVIPKKMPPPTDKAIIITPRTKEFLNKDADQVFAKIEENNQIKLENNLRVRYSMLKW